MDSSELLAVRWWFWLALALVAIAGALEVLRRVRARHRLFFSALLEQGRREHEHDVPYRHDQRVDAVQQRLSRRIGKRAFTTKMRKQIEVHVRGLAQSE